LNCISTTSRPLAHYMRSSWSLLLNPMER